MPTKKRGQMRIIPTMAFIITLAALPHAQSAGAEADIKKLATEFSQAWAKGDAKAIAALHTEEASRARGR